MSILLTQYSEPVLVLFLDYSTHEVHLLQFYSRILKVFYVLKENFQQFFQLLYAISTFRLFINENSCSRNANAIYGVFVIIALKPNVFDPLVTILTGFHSIPLFTLQDRVMISFGYFRLYALQLVQSGSYPGCSTLMDITQGVCIQCARFIQIEHVQSVIHA